MGPLGSGHAMKLAVNGVIFSLNNALSEALEMNRAEARAAASGAYEEVSLPA